MKYQVKLRKKESEPLSGEGLYVADIYRVEWFGLKTTLVAKSTPTGRQDYEMLIRHDYIQHHGGIECEFYSAENGHEDTYNIHH